jgi:hypothetical protein
MGRVKQEYGELWLEGISNGTVNVFMRDFAGNAISCRGSSLPTAGSSGYAVGCQMIKTGSNAGLYVNTGTTTSSAFVAFSPAGGIAQYACVAAVTDAAETGSATQTVTIPGINTADKVLGQYSTTDDTDYIAEIAITADDTVTYVANADPLAAHVADVFCFRPGAEKVWDIFAAGSATTAGGDATETVTVTGALASDKCIVCVTDEGTGDGHIVSAKMSANTVTAVMSADPTDDGTFNYVVFRRAGSFLPSHYIYKMGEYTAVGGDTTTVAITVAGVLATDLVFVHHKTSDDTDIIEAIVPTANTITLTVSADPVTDHSYTYMVVRAVS